jgi:ABC-2 type transport system ATP-binding protein
LTPIAIDRLSKSFKLKRKQIRALDEVSLSVQAGESVGFIGPNGAGKSTTIKILFGAIRADAGEASLMGLHTDNPLSRKGVGYVPESPYLYDQLTPREVLSSGLRMHGIDGDENRRRTETWLERLDIAYAAEKRIRNLSKGMAQRTALAHAFALEPRLLVLDEPMSGLDPIGRRLVADLMQSYRQGGGTLFFSSHILHDVERLADRFIMIHGGRICATQTMAEMLAGQDELVVRYHGTLAADGFQVDASTIWKGVFRRSELPGVMARIEQAGGLLIDIHPQASLERLFDGVVSGDAKP